MSRLASFQDALCQAVAGRSLSLSEQAVLAFARDTPGLALTSAVRRSWCEGRAVKAAHLTLSALPRTERRALVNAWVTQGGGTQPLIHAEADSFLDFIAVRLPDPSHALALCRLERAVNAAMAKSWRFVAPSSTAIQPRTLLLRADGAAIVELMAPIEALVAALDARRPLPPIGATRIALLVAPGIPGLSRAVTPGERALWIEASQGVSGGSALDVARRLVSAGALVPR